MSCRCPGHVEQKENKLDHCFYPVRQRDRGGGEGEEGDFEEI